MSLHPGADFAAAAVGLAGTPYRLHGRDPESGLDCVGLVAAALEGCGRPARPPVGYRLRSVSVEPLLGFATENGFGSIPAEARPLAGDLLLVSPSPVQAHLVIACARGGYVHAHAGLRRVVREIAEVPWPIALRWRLATKG